MVRNGIADDDYDVCRKKVLAIIGHTSKERMKAIILFYYVLCIYWNFCSEHVSLRAPHYYPTLVYYSPNYTTILCPLSLVDHNTFLMDLWGQML